MNAHRICLGGGGRFAIVDIADAALVDGFKWRLLANGYIGAWRGRLLIYLHRLIAGAGSGELVDHINQDPLDNRMVNLRIATARQNAANRLADRRRAGTSSRHKGVSWRKARNCWGAYIHIDGKTRYLGSFQTEDQAAEAYNRAAVMAWGEFARLNDLEGSASLAGDA